MKKFLLTLFISLLVSSLFSSFAQHEEEIEILSPDGQINISATLALPSETSKNLPVAILITGNGRNDRDASMGELKPHKDLSDHLVEKGIAVVRFDKRGVGKSTGNYDQSTSYDFAEDVQFIFDYLKMNKKFRFTKIGLIGHSEGGLITAIVASQREDISFIVSLAGPSLPGDLILLHQQKAIAEAKGIDARDIANIQKINANAFEIVKTTKNPQALEVSMRKYISDVSKGDPDKPASMTEEEYVQAQMDVILSPWMVTFLQYDPSENIQKINCPILCLNGSMDLQVLPKENFQRWKENLALGSNKEVTLIELPNMNHLFQSCETGLPQEYSTINESFSPIALNAISDWLEGVL